MRKSNGKCHFCEIYEETLLHLFFECEIVKEYLSYVHHFLKNIDLENLDDEMIFTPSVMILGFRKCRKNIILVGNIMILVSKWIIWKERNLIKYQKKTSNNRAVEMFIWFKNALKLEIETIVGSKCRYDMLITLKSLLENI